MKREGPKSIAVLTGICLVVAVLLAAVNHVTAPIIEESAQSGAEASLYVVLPNAAGFEEEALTGEIPETVTGVYRDTGGSGYAVTLSTTSSYSASPMTFTLGVSTDGKITGVEMTNYAESKDFGDYPSTYVGQDSTLSGVDLYAGVTYSSQAFKDAVGDAFAVLIELGGVAQGNKTDEQIIEELKPQLLPGALNRAGTPQLAEMTVSDETVQQALQAENDVGYIYVMESAGEMYVVAISTTGGAVCVDLEGTDVTSHHTDLVQRAMELGDTDAIHEKNKTAAARALPEGAELTPISAKDQFGTVSSIYAVSGAENAAYAMVCTPYGYREPMKLVFVLNSGGEITGFRASGELIQNSEYYSNYTLDQSAYIAGLIGLTKDTANEDITLISGATMTGDGVWTALQDVFLAFDGLTAE